MLYQRDYPDYHSLQYILQEVLYLGDKLRKLLMPGNDHRQKKGEVKEQEKQIPYTQLKKNNALRLECL